MSSDSAQTTCTVHSRRDNGRVALAIEGALTMETAPAADRDVQRALAGPAADVTVDLRDVAYCDSGGVTVIIGIHRWCAEHGKDCTVTGMNAHLRGLWDLIDPSVMAPPAPLVHPPLPGVIMRAGEWAHEFAADVYVMLSFLGAVCIGLYQAARHPLRVRWRDVARYFEEAGVNAVPIVTLIHLLLGATLAFLGASQLSQFGANIYVADLVGIALVKEIGPLMTAVLVAGRSGAAFAAEIGTMKVSEEVDAMTVLGFDTQRFLVMPKLLAVFLAMPGLLILADLVGMTGSAIVSVMFLDLTLTAYVQQTYDALTLSLIFEGLVKAQAFAMIVAGVGCMRGFEVSGGADSVGRCTTSAVVSGIFLIVVMNAVFTFLFA